MIYFRRRRHFRRLRRFPATTIIEIEEIIYLSIGLLPKKSLAI